MGPSPSGEVLQIKKYPNRRFYDATRSCHVTLHDLYDLIQAGHNVSITESRNGEDITNLVLLQIILENDQPKLDVFPSVVLHQVIRSNLPALRASVEHFFRPLMSLMSASQKQFDTFWRQFLEGSAPAHWAQQFMRTMGDGADSTVRGAPVPESGSRQEDRAEPDEAMLDELRDQVASLTRKIEQLRGR